MSRKWPTESRKSLREVDESSRKKPGGNANTVQTELFITPGLGGVHCGGHRQGVDAQQSRPASGRQIAARSPSFHHPRVRGPSQVDARATKPGRTLRRDIQGFSSARGQGGCPLTRAYGRKGESGGPIPWRFICPRPGSASSSIGGARTSHGRPQGTRPFVVPRSRPQSPRYLPQKSR